MSTTTEVTLEDFQKLLAIFRESAFAAGSCEEGSEEYSITKKCEYLWKQDYTLFELDNNNGVLCPRYPSRIFIPEFEHSQMVSTITASSATAFSPELDNAMPQNSNTILNNSLDQNNLCLLSSSSSNTTENSTTPSSSTTNIGDVQSFVTFGNTTTNVNQNEQVQQETQQQSQETLQNSNQLQQQHHHYQEHLGLTAAPSVAGATTAPSSNSTTANNTTTTPNTIYEDLFEDANKIREIITMAKYARCRQRFAVPVILYRGKYICRSATISINAETYGRKAMDYAYEYINRTNYNEPGAGSSNSVDDENNDNEDSLMNNAFNETFTYEEVIKSDVQLLNSLNVNTIVDLMVEKRKIKYFMVVSSSEKADPDNRYKDFNLLSLPYPGCEFFKKFRDNNYVANDLYYDWSQSFNDADISVPISGPTNELNINWSEYKTWDLVLATQNYLKACLKYIQEENSGLLIHCISGWDRTPLFISLVRLSLWADGLIHQSLNSFQIIYLTVAYDWYLFGHQLPDRLKRGEDILFFCFHVLKYIVDGEFSIVEPRKRTKTPSSNGSVTVLKRDMGDDESLKDDSILDQDSNESYYSSTNDMSITENFYVTAPPTAPTIATQSTPPTAPTIATQSTPPTAPTIATQSTPPTAPTIATQSTPPHGSSNNLAGNNPITNRSPNAKRTKTSPISVPGASATRQRNESTSSICDSSWHVVSESGSIDSTRNGGSFMRNANRSNNSGNGGSNTNTPGNNSNTNSNLSPSLSQVYNMRKQRLISIRTMFKREYGKSGSLQFK